jgi:alkanesulfonate monooxygenase SsuD/methylene tetrahydromethanopterin reductase-like flavin-dependent oxidoreductase (luciferase family)
VQLYREPAEYFYSRCLHLDPRFMNPPGYTSEATLRARVQSQLARAANMNAAAQGAATTFESIVEQGYVIVGSPDEVAERLREVALELNVGQLMLLLQFGNMSRELAYENTRLFATRVMPQLGKLFDDRWENRWWPRPLPPAERARPREVQG